MGDLHLGLFGLYVISRGRPGLSEVSPGELTGGSLLRLLQMRESAWVYHLVKPIVAFPSIYLLLLKSSIHILQSRYIWRRIFHVDLRQHYFYVLNRDEEDTE